MTRKKKDPKVGTGKKPKGTGRRLYTDENPKVQQMLEQLWQKLKELKNLLLEKFKYLQFWNKEQKLPVKRNRRKSPSKAKKQ
jgi:hypothetical protein